MVVLVVLGQKLQKALFFSRFCHPFAAATTARRRGARGSRSPGAGRAGGAGKGTGGTQCSGGAQLAVLPAAAAGAVVDRCDRHSSVPRRVERCASRCATATAMSMLVVSSSSSSRARRVESHWRIGTRTRRTAVGIRNGAAAAAVTVSLAPIVVIVNISAFFSTFATYSSRRCRS